MIPQDEINTPSRRVLVAVDCERFSQQTLETAAYIASSMRAELQCVFVEDERVLQIADLPFTREVLIHNAGERHLSSDGLARALKAYSQQVRLELERLARRHRLPFSFRTLRVASYQALLSVSSSADLLLLGDKATGFTRRQSSVSGTDSGEVCAIVTGTDGLSRLLGAAVSLAGREHRNLTLYLPKEHVLGRNKDRSPEKVESERLEPELLAGYLGHSGGVIGDAVKVERYESLASVLTLMLAVKPRQTIVLPATALAAEEPLIDRLLAQPGKSIVLVR